MKVLQVNCVYKKGSTGKIVQDIHTELLARGHESIVCYGRGETIREPNVYKTCGEFESHVYHFFANLTGILYGGCFFSTHRLISIIQREKPDVVHLHCINGYFVNIYRLVSWLKKHHVKTVLTLHAEFMHTGGCAHAMDCERWMDGAEGCRNGACPHFRESIASWLFDRTGTMQRRMCRAFEGAWPELTVASVSPWLKDRAERSKILQGKNHCVVLNGIDTSVFCCQEKEAERLRKQQGWENQKVILHVTADYNNPIKGGSYITALSRQMDPETHLLVVVDGKDGEKPEDFRGVYWGRAKSQKELATLYCAADVMVITSSRECLPTTCVEALCCGTPIACFDFHGGLGETAFPKEYVSMVPYADSSGLKNSILQMADGPVLKKQIADKAAKQFSKSVMVEQYIMLYQNAPIVEQKE